MPFKSLKTQITVSTLAGALTLTGCQFGNKNTTELKGYDTISGYYSSLPQSISFHAQIGAGPARDQNGLVNQMPDFMKSVMANPTMLYYDDPLNGIGSLRSHSNTGLGIPTKISDRLSTFGVSTSASAIVAGCKFLEETVHTGSFSQSSTTSVIAGLTVRGNIAIDYSITYSFVGQDVDCNPLRASMKSCYTDNAGCSTDPNSIFYRPFVTQVFAPLINAGVMTDTEIPSAVSVTYHAIYQ